MWQNRSAYLTLYTATILQQKLAEQLEETRHLFLQHMLAYCQVQSAEQHHMQQDASACICLPALVPLSAAVS